jgi:hypothetical protein
MCAKEGELMVRLGIFSAVIMASLMLPAQDVKTDYDHNFDFSQVKTFYVKVGTSWGNPLAEDRAKNAVIQQLTAKGWTQAADENSADAIVVIHGATKTEQSLDTFYSGGGYYGWGWGGGPGMATTTVNEVHVGTGVVDIFDAKTKKLVFRGVAQDEISEKAEKNEKKIEKATQKMFKNFPPKPKSEKAG